MKDREREGGVSSIYLFISQMAATVWDGPGDSSWSRTLMAVAHMSLPLSGALTGA